jgi:hypothetical protein
MLQLYGERGSHLLRMRHGTIAIPLVELKVTLMAEGKVITLVYPMASILDWQPAREKEPENVERQISRVTRGAGMKDTLRATTRVTLKASLRVLMQLNRKKAVPPEIIGSAWLSLDHDSFGK